MCKFSLIRRQLPFLQVLSISKASEHNIRVGTSNNNDQARPSNRPVKNSGNPVIKCLLKHASRDLFKALSNIILTFVINSDALLDRKTRLKLAPYRRSLLQLANRDIEERKRRQLLARRGHLFVQPILQTVLPVIVATAVGEAATQPIAEVQRRKFRRKQQHQQPPQHNYGGEVPIDQRPRISNATQTTYISDNDEYAKPNGDQYATEPDFAL